eukprot:365483_1
MGNSNTPDSMVILTFAEIALILVHGAFYMNLNNVLMVITECNANKAYLEIKFIKIMKIQLIKIYLIILSIILRHFMALMQLLQIFSKTLRIKAIWIMMNKTDIKYNEKFIFIIYNIGITHLGTNAIIKTCIPITSIVPTIFDNNNKNKNI